MQVLGVLVFSVVLRRLSIACDAAFRAVIS